MDNALRPRDIQARIRSGRSVEEVAEFAGLPLDKVERFAAPVLAEREYVAGQAMGAPVRRHGETSGHRKLRVAVSERLRPFRVDIDDVALDSARMEDGRWAVSVSFRVEDDDRTAQFSYDVAARFSVAANADAQWLLGERSDADDDSEPTVDLNDDLAIVRSVTGSRARDAAAPAHPAQPETEDTRPVAPVVSIETAEPVQAADESAEEPQDPRPTGDLDLLYDILDRSGTEYTEDSVEISRPETVEHETGEHETGEHETGEHETVEPDSGEEAGPVHPASAAEPEGVSDASAVPATASEEFESPPPSAPYPVEPSLFDEDPDVASQLTQAAAGSEPESHTTATTAPHQAARSRRRKKADAVPADADVSVTEPSPASEPAGSDAGEPEVPDAAEQAEAPADEVQRNEESPVAVEEGSTEEKPVVKKRGRKRAAVPSWDEIMFGSPRGKQ